MRSRSDVLIHLQIKSGFLTGNIRSEHSNEAESDILKRDNRFQYFQALIVCEYFLKKMGNIENR